MLILQKPRPQRAVWRRFPLSTALAICLWFLGLVWLPGTWAFASPQEPPPPVVVGIDTTRPGSVIPVDLWGTNLTQRANAAQTVENPAFVTATRQLQIRLIRWPGGNNADAYDWKRNEEIRPGRPVQRTDWVDLPRILRFAQEVGAIPSITVNFGTMTAQDAADLVAFLNGPTDSPWGAQRAALGYPEPLGVRYFEVGNEIGQPHMWYYAWTAEDPVKYFFGGAEERRGFYNNAGSQEYDPVGAKGDLFKATGGPGQTYTLRFPPVQDVRVLWAATQEDAQNQNVEEWREVADLDGQPPDAKVFTLDADAGILRFGDGIHGAAPPAGSYFLVEYTTTSHDGFLDYAQAMRAVDSSVPIQIGAAMLPFVDGQPITDTAGMAAIFQAMDFYVRHQYDSGAPQETWDAYSTRRQIAADRIDTLMEVYDRVQEYMATTGITRSLGIGVTEWNIFLNSDYWHINRTLEGGVIAAEWFIRLLNAREHLPVSYAEQFALGGGNLSLIRSQTNGSIAPLGYVFQGFAPWPGSRVLPVQVTGPEALAYDRTVPYVTAAAGLAADGETLRVALVNNAESQTLTATLVITGFVAGEVDMWRLAAPQYTANNETDPDRITLQEIPASPLTALPLPPHSVTFLAVRRADLCGDLPGVTGCRIYLPQVTIGP